MAKKSFTITAGLILFAIGTLAFGSESPSPSLIGELTIPKHVDVFVASSVENNKRVPVLFLSAVAGPDLCDTASDLQIKKSLAGNTLIIDIKGYKFTKGSREGACPTALLESRADASIDPDWLEQNGDKEIVFKLDGQDNKYKISYSRYRVVFNRIQATNVIINAYGHNLSKLTAKERANWSETPASLAINLYPPDVYVLYLAGPVSSVKDYRPAMRKFAQAKGFVPADQIYPGLEQNEKNQFYVILKNHSRPKRFQNNLPGESIGVYLQDFVSYGEQY